MTPLLKLRITAGYPGKPDVLRDVSVEIEPGRNRRIGWA